MSRFRTAAQTADLIGASENWLKRHAKELPHSKRGRAYVWDDSDVAALIEHLRVRPIEAVSSMPEHMRPVPARGQRRAS